MVAHVAPGDGSDVYAVDVSGSDAGIYGMRFDNQGRRRQSNQSAAPTKTVNANAGTSASATVNGSDEVGIVTLTAGSASTAAGAQVTVNFNTPYATTPAAVHLTPTTQQAAILDAYVTATTTGFTISFPTAATASAVYGYSYLVVGGA